MADLFLPTLMADIIDKGVVTGDIAYIWRIGIVMLLVSAIGAAAAIFASYYSAKSAMGLGRDIREKCLIMSSNFPCRNLMKLGTASLITRTTNDITQIQQVVIMMLRMVISAPLMLVGESLWPFQKMLNYPLS